MVSIIWQQLKTLDKYQTKIPTIQDIKANENENGLDISCEKATPTSSTKPFK